MIARAIKVARMHTVAWPLLIAWPVGIVAVSFAIGFTIFYLIGDTGQEANFTGSVFALHGFALSFYLQAMTQTFPFALGLSVTRRDYFAATALVATVQSLVFGVILFAFARIEDATDGWGVKMRMFDIPAYFTDNRWLQLLTIVVSLFLLATIGMFLGALQQRFRIAGLFFVGLIVMITLGLVAILLTWQGWWGSVGSWFADVRRVVPLAALPAAAAAAAIVGTWGLMRRTPA